MREKVEWVKFGPRLKCNKSYGFSLGMSNSMKGKLLYGIFRARESI